MITPVSQVTFKLHNRELNSVEKNSTEPKTSNSLKLSGFNNPMRSYVSFGWCTAHYQAMYEIEDTFSDKISGKLKEIENLKSLADKRVQRYSLVDDNSKLAAKLLTQYANMQCVIAEVPPSYAFFTAEKFKKALDKTQTLTNPISSLISINEINKMNVKNSNLDEAHLERGKGATQLYSIAILLNQINENKDKPEFQANKQKIDELVSITEDSLKDIYGADILERIQYFGKMGKTPTHEQKAAALDFLIEVDSKARSLNLPKEFEKKLQVLIDLQNDEEGLVEESVNENSSNIKIKIQYPDHDHSAMHAHGIPHTHTHSHTHDHTYKDIIEEAKNKTASEKKPTYNDNDNKKTRTV